MVVANAGNAVEDEANLKVLAVDFNVTVTPLDRVFLALQGPAAAGIASSAGLDVSGLSLIHI